MQKIYFLYADGCSDCEEMRKILVDCLSQKAYNNFFEIEDLNSEDDITVDIAVKNGIDDLPGCVIGEHVFYGKNGYTRNSLISALEKTFSQ